MRSYRKKQRDVDVDAVGYQLFNCRGTVICTGYFYHQVGTRNCTPEAPRLGQGFPGIMRHAGRNFY